MFQNESNSDSLINMTQYHSISCLFNETFDVSESIYTVTYKDALAVSNSIGSPQIDYLPW